MMSKEYKCEKIFMRTEQKYFIWLFYYYTFFFFVKRDRWSSGFCFRLYSSNDLTSVPIKIIKSMNNPSFFQCWSIFYYIMKKSNRKKKSNEKKNAYVRCILSFSLRLSFNIYIVIDAFFTYHLIAP